MRPPASVLEAFGAAPAEPLAGVAWRAGNVVLKPLDMLPEALAWQAKALAQIVPDDLRLAVPLRSRTGELIVQGWTAWPYLEGVHEPRWPELIAAGERLHRALRGIPRPEVLDSRADAWAIADRVAWGELPPPDLPGLGRLLAARAPVALPSQVIHGDLSGNVLFAPGLPPAIIDLSPYWRPAAYASAVVAVDAVLWHGAPPTLLDDHDPQLRVRALLFRVLAARDPGALLARLTGPAASGAPS